jgi:hypothetical protein
LLLSSSLSSNLLLPGIGLGGVEITADVVVVVVVGFVAVAVTIFLPSSTRQIHFFLANNTTCVSVAYIHRRGRFVREITRME